MKIFFRSAPLLHLIKEGEEGQGDMRLLGITGDANGTTFLGSGKAPESQNVEAKVDLFHLLYFEEIKLGLRKADLTENPWLDLQLEPRHSDF